MQKPGQRYSNLLLTTLYFQEYSEQWHLLENLQSDLVSETHSEDRQDSAASLQNSTVSNANTQDTEPTGYQQEKVSLSDLLC